MTDYTDLQHFLLELPWSATMRARLETIGAEPGTVALAAHYKDGRLTATAFTDAPTELPAGSVAVWRKQRLPLSDTVPRSKTMQAVDLVLTDGVTVYAAAKQLGIHQSAVHRALARLEDKEVCPCCRQVIREGYSVDPTVLKNPAPRSTSS